MKIVAIFENREANTYGFAVISSSPESHSVPSLLSTHRLLIAIRIYKKKSIRILFKFQLFDLQKKLSNLTKLVWGFTRALCLVRVHKNLLRDRHSANVLNPKEPITQLENRRAPIDAFAQTVPG